MDLHSTQEMTLTKATIEETAKKLFKARRDGNKIETPEAGLRLADAYAIQDALTRLGHGAAAWKTSLPRPDFTTLGIYEMAVCAPICKMMCIWPMVSKRLWCGSPSMGRMRPLTRTGGRLQAWAGFSWIP